ncbi:hypothetical protein [uncultured Photobacterium sp.]|uniref:hypothetical protein n=1 Tax=uncultured Photobacterium sp. TaxID=173973 RepID=UPI00260D1BC5|nr:hypothetical protein [uncultured Photobacterium sp.]
MRITLVALIFFSSFLAAQPETPALPEIHAVPYAKLPDLDALYNKIESSRNNETATYDVKSMLAFFAAVLPGLRYEAYVKRSPLAVSGYSATEQASFEITQLLLTEPKALSAKEYEFYHRRVLNDASNTIDRLSIVLVRLKEEISEREAKL